MRAQVFVPKMRVQVRDTSRPCKRGYLSTWFSSSSRRATFGKGRLLSKEINTKYDSSPRNLAVRCACVDYIRDRDLHSIYVFHSLGVRNNGIRIYTQVGATR